MKNSHQILSFYLVCSLKLSEELQVALSNIRSRQLFSRFIIFCKAILTAMTMTTKIDKIRRKLNETKKKDVLQNITVNQNLSNLLFRPKEQITTSYRKKHLANLPSSPLCNSIDLSTDHSEQSISTDFRRAQHSVLTQKKERKSNHLNVELTSKSLNPTIRINRANNRTVTER